MAKINFFLKEPKSEKKTLIFLVVNHNYQRLKYSTGEYIHPLAWNFDEQRPILQKKFQHNYEINRRLEEYRYFLTDLLGELKRKREEITPQILREKLDENFKFVSTKDDETENKITLLEYIDVYIEECEKGFRLTPKYKTRYKDWTIKGYKTMKYHLENYMEDRKKTLDFDDITMRFYNDLLEYFNSKKLAINTIGKQIKNIKVIMSESFNEEFHNCIDYQKKGFKIITEDTYAIYLNEDELNRIYSLDLSSSKTKHLERARDLFIIAARTALRFEDLTNIKSHNFFERDNRSYLRIQTHKTGVTVVIPLKIQVLEIYNKYEGNLPREMSNQKMNEYIKEVGRMAGINDLVSKSITKGGISEENYYKKWELITTHTARRSAATNMFLAGIPAISIMKITGHKTERAFMKYIRMSEEDNAYKMAENDYFKNDYVEKPNLSVVG